MDAESAKNLSLKSLRLLSRYRLLRKKVYKKAEPIKLMGLSFPNCVGLAAGLDKNGEYIDALAVLGFGFIEIGAVTPKPQPGHPRPRLFRIPEAQAAINRMGFNNKGVDHLVRNIKKCKYKGIIGVNIGKNKNTSNADAVKDYLHCMQRVYPYASFITINISSPNTENIRELQFGEYLHDLLARLKQEQETLRGKYAKQVPLLVKLAPDLDNEEIATIAQILLNNDIDGVIATNASLQRTGIEDLPNADKPGGMSGRPLFPMSLAVVTELCRQLDGKIPVIACGGIVSKENAEQMFAAGAALVQVYTGLIYQGPQLIKDIAML